MSFRFGHKSLKTTQKKIGMVRHFIKIPWEQLDFGGFTVLYLQRYFCDREEASSQITLVRVLFFLGGIHQLKKCIYFAG